MSIAPPRESSLPPNRRPHPISSLHTPTGSTRPSIDSPRLNSPRPPRSNSVSPNRTGGPPRRNRAALREYYKLKSAGESIGGGSGSVAGTVKEDDVSSEFSVNDHGLSDVVESELDSESFDVKEWTGKVLREQGLGELLKTYNGVLTDIRALDAEKKALVYDNYSKLIAATETIRKMRANMDPLNPMASTLDPAISDIYKRANEIKAELRKSLGIAQLRESEMTEDEQAKIERRNRACVAVKRVLDTPGRLRLLVADGKEDEATAEWVPVLKVLRSWESQGKGGNDVADCIAAGEAALKGAQAAG